MVAAGAQCWAQEVRTVSRGERGGRAPGLAVEQLSPITDDEGLMEALVALGEGQPALALEEIPVALESAPAASQEPLQFALAYAYFASGRWSDALEPLAACSREQNLFADYCLYWGAQSAFEREDFATAQTLSSMVAWDAVYGPRSRYLSGRSLAMVGRHGEAVDVFVAFLADHPDAWYRRDVEFDLAASYEATGDWDEAARIYHRIALLNPGSDAETRATDALNSLSSNLSAEVRAEVMERSASEEVERAQVLYDRHRSEEVIAMLQPIVDDPETPARTRCHAAYMVGKSHTKLRHHGDAVAPYEVAVEACLNTDEDERVRALYNLGRSLWNIDRNEDAYLTYERIWEEHPTSSYADDAFVYAARVRENQGRSSAMEQLLAEQMVRYPDGDMLGEAVWLLMARHYRAGRYESVLDLAAGLDGRTGETDRYTRGRTRYFAARSREYLGEGAAALDEYEAIVRAFPMGWYALLSLNRLLDEDEERARALVAELRTESETTEEVIELRPPELQQDPFFRRGTTLLRLGLYELAGGEFDKLRSRYSNEPDIEWVLAMLFNQAGAYHLSYQMPGGRGDVELAYPAGSNLERWRIAYPRPYESTILRYAGERDLDENLVYGIMRQESGFRADIESWANARGLLQLMQSTANDMARLTGRGSVSSRQLFNPTINIELGTMFIRRMSDHFDQHPAVVIASYNGGMGNVGRWLRERGELPLDLWVEEIPYAQTQHYVKGVTTTYWVYAWLYGEGDPWVALPFDLSGIGDE